MTRARAALLLALLPVALAAIVLRAEGPLYVGGPPQAVDFPNGYPGSVPGLPYKWVNDASHTPFPLTYWTDQGNLGTLNKTGTNGADALVQAAFQVWQDVRTANISMTKAGDLGGNVTASNALAVENALYDCSTLPGNPAGGIAKPRTIIFDDASGSIVSALGEDPNTILGFADTPCLESDGTHNYFTRGFAVLNGRFTDTTSDQVNLKAVMIHEFGHMLGLDHSQINVQCLGFLGCSDDPDALEGLPTMFPYLVDGAAMSTLATDDIAGLSALYPETVDNSPDQVPFATTMGRITGRIYFSDGVTPAEGINVVARLVDDPLTVQDESKRTAVSCASGFLFTADASNPVAPYPGYSPSPFGSQDPALIGYYEIPGLPPGNYTVEIEAFNGSFTLGSGIGPLGSYGMVFPMPSTACPDGEFLNTGESNNDVCTDKTPLSVTAGGDVSTGTDIILNGTPPRFDVWESE